MKRSEVNELKERITKRKEKESDLDIIVSHIMQLPYGQMKKVLSDEVLAVLAKYGYTE